ncbi:glutathione S-transferase family protein [Gemmobacter denitrificans]|uniref:Glutathione S-transferase n=1 Tax=Gemmobacter denitrificans TaxID=3123040 RepID=A0ABU8BWJ6_9RHOB
MTTTLYCFGESGHSYKVALALALTGQTWQPRFVDFFNGETRSPEFRALNPMGECPVLVEGDTVLTQSGSILMHLAEKTGQLAGQTQAERTEVLRWVLWDNHKMSSQVGMLRFLRNFLPADKRPAEVIAFTEGRVKSAYAVLNTQLATRDWLAGGNAITAADISCCSYLFYPEPFGFDRAEWPHIDSWLTRIAALPGWKHPYALMPGNPSDRAAK